MNILVVEDDSTLNKNIKEAFLAENWLVESVFDGLLAERLLKKQRFDCVVLDVNLPGKTGFDLCREFRFVNTNTPILMLTAFGELEDKVKGFDCGADDYLTKPFFMRELILRVHSLLKRNKLQSESQREGQIIQAGNIQIHPASKKVTRLGTEIIFTPREYQILCKLCENQGEVIPKNELIQEIWGKSVDANTNTIEVYINFIRNKIDKPFGTNTIKTKFGYGYYFEAE